VRDIPDILPIPFGRSVTADVAFQPIELAEAHLFNMSTTEGSETGAIPVFGWPNRRTA